MKKYLTFKKNCLQCEREIIKPANFGKTKWLNKKFCSMECNRLYKKGKPNGLKHTEEFKKSVSVKHSGKINSIKTRKAMSVSKLGKSNPNWKGGISPINTLIRMSLEYKLWREAVFTRDNYTCIWCGKKQGWNKETKSQNKIHADHIKPFCDYPEIRFAIDNGRTLCVECHKTTNTFGVKRKINI
jgi:hypothetical protein